MSDSRRNLVLAGAVLVLALAALAAARTDVAQGPGCASGEVAFTARIKPLLCRRVCVYWVMIRAAEGRGKECRQEHA